MAEQQIFQRGSSAYVMRHIAPEDDPAVAALIRQVMPQFGAGGDGFAINDPEVDFMCAAYAEPGRGYWVIEGPEGVLGGGGFAQLVGADPSICELRKMYFRAGIRGLGLGRALLERCLRGARAAGYAACYLETLATMQSARRLYLRAGFEFIDRPLGATGHCGCDRYMIRAL